MTNCLTRRLFRRPRMNRFRPSVQRLERRETPTVYNVDTTSDIINASDGLLSLREAVRAANATQEVSDTIILTAGTYTLTISGANEDVALTGDLDITDGVTIRGAG